MNRKLNCILLIDDDEPTNFYHQLVIEEVECAETVVCMQSGKSALEFLQSKEDGQHPQPDLIFLDINMPAMNGWEFLEEYEKLNKDQQGKIVMIMLSTSLNPDDKDKANNASCVEEFMNKPLTVELIEEILSTYFPDNI